MKTMKKNLLALGIILMSALTFTACSDDDDINGGKQPEVSTTDVYVSCAGNLGANNGTVGILDYNIQARPTAPFVFRDAYKAQNGIGIGDAQDLIVFHDKVVVACTTSSKVEVLNRQGKVEQTIKLHNVEPRYLATDGKYVYFSAYSGKVYKMNPNDKVKPMVDSVVVGDYPEALSVANGKVYVNISRKGNTIVAVDCNTFKNPQKIEVGLNPYNQNIVAGNDIFIVSMFDYVEKPLVQKIDTKTNKVTQLFNATAIAYSAKKNALVCLYAPYGSTDKSFFLYDLATGQKTNLDMTGLRSPQQVNVDKWGNIYVIDTPDYNSPSEVFYYSPEGKLIQGNIIVGMSAQNVRFAN